MKHAIVILLTGMLTLSACATPEQTINRNSAQRAGDKALEETQEALGATGKYIQEEKKVLDKQMSTALENINRELEELKADTPENRQRREQLEEAKVSLKKLQDKTKDAGQKAWTDIKGAWSELDQNIERQVNR